MATARNGSAAKMRRKVRTCQTMRHDSAHDGGDSSVTTASADAPIARRSCAPRTGSRMRSARAVKIRIGTTNTKKGVRHPK